jgi:hypothetical protein
MERMEGSKNTCSAASLARPAASAAAAKPPAGESHASCAARSSAVARATWTGPALGRLKVTTFKLTSAAPGRRRGARGGAGRREAAGRRGT